MTGRPSSYTPEIGEAIIWRTETWPVAKLKDWPSNPRRMTQKGIADLKASMTRLGYIDPIAVNTDGTIIGGHARKKVLRELGISEVEVRVPDRTLTDKEIEEAIIRLNKNIAGEWDFDILANAFDTGELVQWGFTPEELGIVEATAEGLTDPDDVPEPPTEPVSKLGDVWILGNHRLMCGSSTEAHAVERMLNGVKPLLMVTDPPYGVEYDATWRKAAMPDINSGKTGGMHGKVLNDSNADWREAWALFPGEVAYIWHAGNKTHVVAESLIACDLDIRAQIIWVKHQFVIGRGHYHPHHEPCWYVVRKGGKGHWNGDRKQSTIWHIDKPLKSETGHSTQKPIECMKRPIENNSSLGQAVYEPFSGSGTTIIAAEMTGRCAYAMELNPAYVDMAVIRWQNFTGKQAIHADTGLPFGKA